MSKKKNNHVEPSTEVEVVTSEVDTVETLEIPVEEKHPEFATGQVTGCHGLNVREHPDLYAEVLCALPVTSEVQVDISNSYADWYHVFTKNGVEGFCMKKYISINS
jgi:hypothetical protein